MQNFALALHELGTNAGKYGALSNDSGKVEILWTIAGDGKANRLKFNRRKEAGHVSWHLPAKVSAHCCSRLRSQMFELRIEVLTREIDLLLDPVQYRPASSRGSKESDQ
jgi:two-component sensor histidine kinase